MAICNEKKYIYIILNLLFLFFFILSSHAEQTFEKLGDKKVSFLDFFLLKYENKLIRRSYALRSQMFVTRVQYSSIGIEVDFDNKTKKILTSVYAVMNKARYTKKNYNQKLSDCNQVRNLIFYRRHGYKFFSQKRDPTLSESVMVDIFKEVFFNNIDFAEEEIEFLLNHMFVKVTVFHPVKKIELVCSGKINAYKLK